MIGCLQYKNMGPEFRHETISLVNIGTYYLQYPVSTTHGR
jgi:hypothetical protein